MFNGPTIVAADKYILVIYHLVTTQRGQGMNPRLTPQRRRGRTTLLGLPWLQRAGVGKGRNIPDSGESLLENSRFVILKLR